MERVNPELQLLGLLPTMVEAYTSLGADVVAELPAREKKVITQAAPASDLADLFRALATCVPRTLSIIFWPRASRHIRTKSTRSRIGIGSSRFRAHTRRPERVLCPVIAIATRSGQPERTRFRATVRRRSWKSLAGFLSWVSRSTQKRPAARQARHQVLRQSPTGTHDDALLIERNVPAIRNIAPLRFIDAEVRYGGRQGVAQAVGTTAEYEEVTNLCRPLMKSYRIPEWALDADIDPMMIAKAMSEASDGGVRDEDLDESTSEDMRASANGSAHA